MPSKWRNVRVPHQGHWHDSKKERARCFTLQILEQRGEILDLQRQVNHELRVNGQLICRYRSDFEYAERIDHDKWVPIVEDVKGKRTDEYMIKRKLMLACHGIEIRET